LIPEVGAIHKQGGFIPWMVFALRLTLAGGYHEPKILEIKERKEDIADRNKVVGQYSPHSNKG
jgi:hypothetical protein